MTNELSLEKMVTDELKMTGNIKKSHEKITQWWNRENHSPVLDLRLLRENAVRNAADDFWPDENTEPEMGKVVAEQIRSLKNNYAYGADAAPEVYGNYGSRGTPMVLSFFLGANPVFGSGTIWYDPIITDIRTFDPGLDPDNYWLNKSLQLFSEQCKQALSTGVMPCIPGIGDYLTNLSGLRGTQELIFDCVDYPDQIRRIRSKMVEYFLRVYKKFEALYPDSDTGTCTWLAWAPGTTYPVQCDFSTVLSPDMFDDLVLPELDYLSDYIKYMCWHLDGPAELKHLNSLLKCPHLKAIQWIPGAGQKSATDPIWEEVIKKILGEGKSIQIYANIDQTISFCERHKEPGIYIRCYDLCNKINIEKIRKYLGRKMW